MPLYPFAYEEVRHPPTSGAPKFTPAMRNVRPRVEFPAAGPQDAPDPIRQQDDNYMGKPIGHAVARVPIAVSLNAHSILGIMEEVFQVVGWARPAWTGTPPHSGGELSWHERTNVTRPPAIAYGSLFSLPGAG